MSNDLHLQLYPNQNGFIGKIQLSRQSIDQSFLSQSDVSTIVVLDRSGSMGNSVPRFVNEILPQIFRILDYSNDELITLITFDSSPNLYRIPLNQLGKYSIKCQGQTMMAPAIELLRNFIQKQLPKDCRSIRLLTISDGEVHDQPAVQNVASQLALAVKNDYSINSQAVRLFTSSSQPDTRAVSSLLQLNNICSVNLLDLKTNLSNDEISMTIASLFSEDSLHQHVILRSDRPIFKNHPWQKNLSSTISLFPGENLSWLNERPQNDLFIGQIKIEIHLEENLTIQTYETLLRQKIDNYLNQLKILKVVNTVESQREIAEILNCFQEIERDLMANETDVSILLNDASLNARLEYIKKSILRKRRSFVMRMSQIANDDKVSQLNSAQQADYLRSVDQTSKNARGLARRAVTQGLDFNEILRQEVRTMSQHLDELKTIDDSEHLVSFFSQDTTLGGIRAVCQLVQDEMLDEADVNDILRMINLVGLACSGPIGEFPDPMTWRVNELYFGCYVSLSDVLTGFIQSKGQTLRTPATNKEITNVIPIIEDKRIAEFLKNYAPHLIEYTCSIGMRRLIADVPMTGGYTVCAALWKSVEDLNENKSNLHLETFDRLVKTYEMIVGNYFQHVLPYIKEQDTNLSYYIANNGTTNMISPLISLFRQNQCEKLKNLPRILRALYTYEVWQAVRRQYKNRDDSDQIAQKMLDRLIGLDIEKYKSSVRPLFEVEPSLNEIDFHHEIHLDRDYLAELRQTFSYVDFVTLLPTFISASIREKLDELKEISPIDDEFIRKTLKIHYDFEQFRFYNVFQALFYTSKTSRVDSEKETMKILDLIDEHAASKMIEDYIRKRFENQYATDLALKNRAERMELTTELVRSIVEAQDHQTMIELLRQGLTRGKVQVAIVNSSSLGFVELKEKLLNLKEKIPRRLDLIKVFLLGRDYKNNDEPVWNNGNVLFTPDFASFEKIFIDFGFQDEWNRIKDEYLKRNLHVYRDGFNRHGHGNPKPSYWAFGHATLQVYRSNVSTEIFDEYCRIHHDCCGVSQLLQILNSSVVPNVVVSRRQQKKEKNRR